MFAKRFAREKTVQKPSFLSRFYENSSVPSAVQQLKPS
ncbi:hypothetical protein [Polaromonas sp. CG9_12]|nr:hypothetical protein [Polaromonas sp. CG9_12]